MKIVQLTAENVKRLKAVEITPDGAIQIVAGRNAQGKSSVIDSIWMALKWSAATHSTPRPIRDGEDQARVTLDLGDLKVTRTWDGDKVSLTVEDANGVPQGRPQELLDRLVGKLSFDPLAFTQQGDKDQVSTLMGLVELPFDPESMAMKRQAMYDKRHLIGQEATRFKGAFEAMPIMASNGLPYEDLPTVEVPMGSLVSEYQVAVEAANARGRAEDYVRNEQATVDRLTAELKAAKDRLKVYQASVDTMRPMDAIQADVDHLKVQMDEAEATNKAIREGVAYFAAKKTWMDAKAEWDELDEAIAHLDQTKADALAAAKFPIDGLSFDDNGVTYNGVPFRQASSAEQLKVSLAIAMALNPTLRVIRITDGSLLDAENLALVESMATDNDFQVWVERVGDGDKAGVVIEDGRVL